MSTLFWVLPFSSHFLIIFCFWVFLFVVVLCLDDDKGGFFLSFYSSIGFYIGLKSTLISDIE